VVWCGVAWYRVVWRVVWCGEQESLAACHGLHGCATLHTMLVCRHRTPQLLAELGIDIQTHERRIVQTGLRKVHLHGEPCARERRGAREDDRAGSIEVEGYSTTFEPLVSHLTRSLGRVAEKRRVCRSVGKRARISRSCSSKPISKRLMRQRRDTLRLLHQRHLSMITRFVLFFVVILSTMTDTSQRTGRLRQRQCTRRWRAATPSPRRRVGSGRAWRSQCLDCGASPQTARPCCPSVSRRLHAAHACASVCVSGAGEHNASLGAHLSPPSTSAMRRSVYLANSCKQGVSATWCAMPSSNNRKIFKAQWILSQSLPCKT
jgi:hypothetical protein